jgi:hypothetical protein
LFKGGCHDKITTIVYRVEEGEAFLTKRRWVEEKGRKRGGEKVGIGKG